MSRTESRSSRSSRSTRSSRRSTARLLAVAASAGAVALAAPAALAATPAHTALPAQVGTATAAHESHALHGLRRTATNSVVSGNWSGYAATGSSGGYTSVSASWVQPSVSCGSQDTYSSFWVGLDGYSNSALEQTGTEADCIGGQAQYGAWWEVLPASESSYSVTVAPGDHLTATVTYNGSGSFTMKLVDSTRGWTKSTTHSGSSGFQNSSAEVIAEAPTVGGQIAPLADFGTVNFTGSTADGSALAGHSPTEIIMEGGSGAVLAQPGSLSSESFSDTWKRSS